MVWPRLSCCCAGAGCGALERRREEEVSVGIFAELARYPARWQGIVMRQGAREDVTLEMAVSV